MQSRYFIRNKKVYRTLVRYTFLPIIDPISRKKYWLQEVQILQRYIASAEKCIWETVQITPIKYGK